jgi:hypothetical protein
LNVERKILLSLALTALCSPAAGQTVYGVPLPQDRGPWVIGDVLFQGNRTVSAASLQDAVRARRGLLYTPADVTNDLVSLRGNAGILGARAAIYGIPEVPVPESYRSISVSTMVVRVVFTVEEKELLLPGLTPATTKQEPIVTKTIPAAALSGVVMTPTAYRGLDQDNHPGLGLDANAVYFIGRLYGTNKMSSRPTNYIDRVGVWFLSVDGKMQVQSESTWRPAVSVGAEGILTFRDAPQPAVQSPGVTASVSAKTTRTLSEGYVVASKKLGPVRSSVGFAQGNGGDRVALLTEFLSPTWLYTADPGNVVNGTEAKSRSVFFASLLTLPKPHVPLAIEFMKPNGMIRNPYLINLKVGYFLKLNFDLAYLKFAGGWDLLGMFQFRYAHFPRPLRKR